MLATRGRYQLRHKTSGQVNVHYFTFHMSFAPRKLQSPRGEQPQASRPLVLSLPIHLATACKGTCPSPSLATRPADPDCHSFPPEQMTTLTMYSTYTGLSSVVRSTRILYPGSQSPRQGHFRYHH